MGNFFAKLINESPGCIPAAQAEGKSPAQRQHRNNAGKKNAHVVFGNAELAQSNNKGKNPNSVFNDSSQHVG